MTPLLRQLYVLRRRKKMKIERRNLAAKRAEARAIEGAKQYRAERIATWCDEIRYREEFRIMRGKVAKTGN